MLQVSSTKAREGSATPTLSGPGLHFYSYFICGQSELVNHAVFPSIPCVQVSAHLLPKSPQVLYGKHNRA